MFNKYLQYFFVVVAGVTAFLGGVYGGLVLQNARYETRIPEVQMVPIEPTPSIVQEEKKERLQDEQTVLSPAALSVRAFDIQSVVLVRCRFRPEGDRTSDADRHYNIGTGIIISEQGYVLTARHVVDPRTDVEESGIRKWELEECEAAQTNREVQEISFTDSAAFMSAELVFRVPDELYYESRGIDAALLQLSDQPSSFTPLVPHIVLFQQGAPLRAIGYPGRDSLLPQKLERLDGQFSELIHYEESLCDGTLRPCGLRYKITRTLSEYVDNFWNETDFGIITPNFRRGFSGAPVFYNGNLIGIVTHGTSGQDLETSPGQDQAFILTSYDIYETIKDVLEDK